MKTPLLHFPVLDEPVGGTIRIKEAQAAVAFAFTELKLVVEPGGVVALAAMLSGKLPTRERVLAVVLT